MKWLTIICVFVFPDSYAQVLENKLFRCKPAAALDSVYCGSYPAFENHQTKQGRKININIIVIPAIDQRIKKIQFFILMAALAQPLPKTLIFSVIKIILTGRTMILF
jgi:penicillin-binding protein-related factor A (putative recombinase)